MCSETFLLHSFNYSLNLFNSINPPKVLTEQSDIELVIIHIIYLKTHNNLHSGQLPYHFNQAADATPLCSPGTGDTPLQRSAKQTTCNHINSVSCVCKWNIWYRQLIDLSSFITDLQFKMKMQTSPQSTSYCCIVTNEKMLTAC
jgi:hypothetical protein